MSLVSGGRAEMFAFASVSVFRSGVGGAACKLYGLEATPLSWLFEPPPAGTFATVREFEASSRALGDTACAFFRASSVAVGPVVRFAAFASARRAITASRSREKAFSCFSTCTVVPGAAGGAAVFVVCGFAVCAGSETAGRAFDAGALAEASDGM